jgi:hypothetical protein
VRPAADAEKVQDIEQYQTVDAPTSGERGDPSVGLADHKRALAHRPYRRRPFGVQTSNLLLFGARNLEPGTYGGLSVVISGSKVSGHNVSGSNVVISLSDFL